MVIGTKLEPARNYIEKLRWFRSDWLLAIALILMIGVACFQVAESSRVLSATIDEPIHIGAGMEWLDRGTYTYDLLHPPLARAILAIGPYLRGLRSSSSDTWAKGGNAILASHGDYQTNLVAARTGNLLFLLDGPHHGFRLEPRRWFSRASAFWAVLLFVNLPPILGHAGLAMLDVACAATVAAALYAFVRCVENPSWPRLILLGASLALAFLCKYSSFAFLGFCFLVAAVYAGATNKNALARLPRSRDLFLRPLLVCSVAFLLLWAGYRFSTAPMSSSVTHRRIDQVLAGAPRLRCAAYRVVEARWPLGEVFTGIRKVRDLNAFGPRSFLLGKYKRGGWWYFFPVTLAFKTPIGFLLLSLFGAFAIARGGKSVTWQQHLTLLFPLTILLVCMNSQINRYYCGNFPVRPVHGERCSSRRSPTTRSMASVPREPPLRTCLRAEPGSYMSFFRAIMDTQEFRRYPRLRCRPASACHSAIARSKLTEW